MKTYICLVDELYLLFNKHDASVASRWEALFNMHRCASLDIKRQMHEINNFWRLQLGLLNNLDTFRCRQAIVDDIDVPMWLYNYERYVLPTIIDNNLPNMEPTHVRVA